MKKKTLWIIEITWKVFTFIIGKLVTHVTVVKCIGEMDDSPNAKGHLNNRHRFQRTLHKHRQRLCRKKYMEYNTIYDMLIMWDFNLYQIITYIKLPSKNWIRNNSGGALPLDLKVRRRMNFPGLKLFQEFCYTCKNFITITYIIYVVCFSREQLTYLFRTKCQVLKKKINPTRV